MLSFENPKHWNHLIRPVESLNNKQVDAFYERTTRADYVRMMDFIRRGEMKVSTIVKAANAGTVPLWTPYTTAACLSARAQVALSLTMIANFLHLAAVSPKHYFGMGVVLRNADKIFEDTGPGEFPKGPHWPEDIRKMGQAAIQSLQNSNTKKPMDKPEDFVLFCWPFTNVSLCRCCGPGRGLRLRHYPTRLAFSTVRPKAKPNTKKGPGYFMNK